MVEFDDDDPDVVIELEIVTDTDPRSFLDVTAEQIAWSRKRDVAEDRDRDFARQIVDGINKRRALVGLAPIN